MTEEETPESNTHRHCQKRTARILLSITASCLLVISVSGFFFILSGRSRGGHPITSSQTPLLTASTTPIYLDTPPAQAEFYDTFKNNAQNWSVSNASGYLRTINPAGLTLTNTKQGSTLIESLPTGSLFANCKIIVDLTMLKIGLNDSVGFFIRGDTNLEHDYRIDLYGDGTFDIAKEYLDAKNTPQTIVLAKSKSYSVLKPEGNINTISLTMNGPQLRLYINNVRVSSVTDSDYGSGQVALFARLDRNSREIAVRFSQVEIDKISGTLEIG